MSAAKCPAIRSFPRFLALREMRRRPRAYLPMFCIYFGVMLLLFNLFIYTESRIQSDILYYKVNTQWILPELTDAEITVLRAEEDVQAVIDEYTTGRWLGIFGEPRVNVLKVNLALDGILTEEG